MVSLPLGILTRWLFQIASDVLPCADAGVVSDAISERKMRKAQAKAGGLPIAFDRYLELHEYSRPERAPRVDICHVTSSRDGY
jgi:hypothetical protein